MLLGKIILVLQFDNKNKPASCIKLDSIEILNFHVLRVLVQVTNSQIKNDNFYTCFELD